MEIIQLKIKDIKPYEKNAKIHTPEQIEQIKKSIEEFGMNDPIAVWGKDNLIVEGHGRLEALKQLGYEEAPCIRLDHLTDEERRAYTLAHNKLTMNTDFDLDMLNDELFSIDTIDMANFGFEVDLPIEEHELEQDNYEVEVPEEPKTKLGDIYQLGNHRVMCGDSTSAEDISKLTGGVMMDLIVTDPPYNVDLGEVNKIKVKMAPERYKGANCSNIANDKMSDEAFVEFLTKAFENADEHLKTGGAFYIWHSSTENYKFQTAMENVGWDLRQILIWNKSSLCLGLSDYQWKHEPCLYGWKSGAGHYFINVRNETTTFEGLDEDIIDHMSKEELKDKLHEIMNKIPATVIDEHKPLKCGEHPTMKPIRLIGKLIRNSSKIGENVLDMFGGSGSTLIASEGLGRNCYMMEYEPKYVDVIIDRWETLTGKKAVKIND